MHLGMTKDKSKRTYRWRAMEPGFYRHMGEKNLSMKAVATRIGISYDAFTKYFGGIQSPSWDRLEQLETYYKAEIGDLTCV